MSNCVTLSEFQLPLARPIRTPDGAITTRTGFLIELQQDEYRGIGEATPLLGWTEDIDRCHDELTTIRTTTTKPWQWELPIDAPAARHGIQLAVTDLGAHAAGQSLATYLAGERANRSVPVNATIGSVPVDELANSIRNAIDNGFPAVKIKVGHEPVDTTFARLTEIAPYTSDIAVRLDANQAWHPHTAEQVIEEAANIGIDLIEEPLEKPTIAALGTLSDTPVQIALDETLIDHPEPDHKTWLTAVDAVVIKPMAIGGIDRAIQLVSQARQYNVEPILSTTIDGVIARAAAVHVAAAVGMTTPSGLGTGSWIREDLTDDIVPVNNGQIAVPDGPGIGVGSQLNTDVITVLPQ